VSPSIKIGIPVRDFVLLLTYLEKAFGFFLASLARHLSYYLMDVLSSHFVLLVPEIPIKIKRLSCVGVGKLKANSIISNRLIAWSSPRL